MSTYSELEARCKRRLGRRGMTITTEFLDEMQAAQEELEDSETLPKWMKTTTGDLSTVSGNTILTDIPPTGFIRVYDDQALVYDDDDGNEKRAIRLDTRNQLISKKNAGVSGEIYWFLVSKTEVEIAPELTRDTVFRMTYYAAQTVLSGANENNWLVNEPNLILGKAGQELAQWLRDDRALQYYQGLEARARAQMVKRTEADEWGDVDLVMGGPD